MTFKLTEIPKRRYRNFQDYCHQNGGNYGQPYRCEYCDGYGRVVADDEPRDPIEGYKLARRVPCRVCKGTGAVTEAQKRHWYLAHRREETQRIAQARRQRVIEGAALRKARKHLTKDERKVLGIEQ